MIVDGRGLAHCRRLVPTVLPRESRKVRVFGLDGEDVPTVLPR
jgi:hypothetical protein